MNEEAPRGFALLRQADPTVTDPIVTGELDETIAAVAADPADTTR